MPGESTANMEPWYKRLARRGLSGKRSRWGRTVMVVLCQRAEGVGLALLIPETSKNSRRGRVPRRKPRDKGGGWRWAMGGGNLIGRFAEFGC